MSNHSDILNQFIKEAEAASAIVTNLSNEKSKFSEVILNILKDEDDVLISVENELYEDLFSALIPKKNFILNPTDDQLKSVRTGITSAFCGIASTGSICISTKNHLANYISMLCRNHIVIIKNTNIIPGIDYLFNNELFDKKITSSCSIITGSSATADMGPLVRGVHGPGILHIIII
ncbi:LUD domain-containing protein [Rosettibacter firmus]|uniref:LUD domain-containing protein n=1 Tax=Rosettibacter firmus TaxID=3111522 RepID=UPI00336BF078